MFQLKEKIHLQKIYLFPLEEQTILAIKNKKL